ncbi:MAG: chemotaxis protein CheC [Promethearchaeota archaeon]
MKNVKKYLITEIGNDFIGFDLEKILEVNEFKEIRKIPLTPPYIAGIIIQRNEAIPILDLKKLFQHPYGQNNFNKYLNGSHTNRDKNLKKHKNQIIIININIENKIGFIIDRLGDITDNLEENIPDVIPTEIPLELISDIYSIKNQSGNTSNSIIILDLNKIYEIISEKIKNYYQKTNELPLEDTNKNQQSQLIFEEEDYLNENTLDALKELINIASGNATTTISELFEVDSIIKMHVPNVYLQTLGDIFQLFENPEEKFVAIRSNISSNEINGTNLILISLNNFIQLIKNLNKSEYINLKIPKRNKSGEFKFNKDLISVAQEIGNIIIGNYSAAISNFLNIKIESEVPQFTYDMIGAILNSLAIQGDKYTTSVLSFLTKMEIKSAQLDLIYLFVPWWDSIESTIDSLNKLINTSKTSAPIKIESTQKSKEIESIEKTSFNIQFQENSLENNADLLDLIREIGNIGAGNAGNALSAMINKKVMLEIPEVKYIPLNELNNIIPIKENIVGISSSIENNFNSNILLFFSIRDIRKILSYFIYSTTKSSPSMKNKLSSNEQEAIVEIYNILIGHYISALSNFLGTKLPPPKHKFFTGKLNNFFLQIESINKIKDKNTKVIVVETILIISSNPKTKTLGYFMLLPTKDTIEQIIIHINKL